MNTVPFRLMPESESSLGHASVPFEPVRKRVSNCTALHTPGPWDLHKTADYDNGWIIEDCCGYRVAMVPNLSERPENLGNAHAILAIPELLAAFRAMDAHYSGSLDYQPAYVKLARAALSRATPADQVEA